MSVTFEDIRAAASRIRPMIHRTQVMTSRTFNRLTGLEAYFKCENFQRGGAFKLRGAANFLLSMSKEELSRGVVAFSSGNHAQAVAIAAAELGAAATIAMPTDAPASKVAATRGYGARIVTYDRLKDDREAVGRGIAEQSGAMLAPPFDHPWIIAGQGTAALELLEEAPALDALVVCIGGGGLISGCSLAARGIDARIRVFGVEPEDANDTQLSLRAGKRVEVPPPKTIADGLRPTMPGKLTFPIIQRHVEDVLLVSDGEIRQAMEFLLLRMKILVEPSGAVPAAAALSGKLPGDLRRVGFILSGGNVDMELLASPARG